MIERLVVGLVLTAVVLVVLIWLLVHATLVLVLATAGGVWGWQLRRRCSQAWGWRLEISLALGSAGLLRLGSSIGPGGPVLVLGMIGVAFWQVPSLRLLLTQVLHRASLRRWFERALRACAATNATGRRPSVRSVDPVPTGLHLRVRVPLGQHAGHVFEAAEPLAAALRVREVRVTRDAADASIAHVVVVRRDPFTGPPMPWPDREAHLMSLWEPIALGVDESGTPVRIGLPEHNLLLGGEPGAGKSAALSVLVAAAALDPTVSIPLLDG